MADSKMYSIPEKFRKTENLHILFWLVKDISWAMLWKPLGILMILPTISVAILITWQTRKIKAELFHNLAIDFWITANATWMILEFTGHDDPYRKYTAIPFSIGLFFILSYYLYILPREKAQERALRKAEQNGLAAIDDANERRGPNADPHNAELIVAE